MSERTPHYGRAFDAVASAEWMITEDALRNMLAIASRTNPVEAVEAYRAEPVDQTFSLKIRDGVAILPVTGPITRYMSWFSLFSGGTSIQTLARDFQSALDNPDVHAIMFEINSPGGQVTGLSEFAEMVFKGRKQKPITARVGGMACSAAYWIASACGDIVIDETALLGSIGVMLVTVDDRKAQEQAGELEIEIISSQSPYKNKPAWTDEGKKRLQSRTDALAQIFVEKVARNRGESVDDVLSNYGQGDVLVGQAAIDAGMADRLGSFEDTITQLARTHTPGYAAANPQDEEDDAPLVDPDQGPDDIEAAQKTISDTASVNSQPVNDQEAASSANADTETSGETMKNENQEPATASENKDTAAQPAAEQQETAKAAPAQPSANDNLPTDVAELQRQLKDSQARIESLEADATNAWIDEQVKAIGGESESTSKVLTSLVGAFGKDSDEVKAYVEQQTALVAQVQAAGLFEEKGSTRPATDGDSAEAKLEALAKARASEKGISFEKAYEQVLGENKDLATEALR